ncbi:hypothetical protein BDY21DRAFT_197385 [Lineolata rhizophorae]|uniref:Uncharacterized protein n=1 Tax=Lineolata rhizophorae TaxID=578093 RepID=A0A6A6P666_9PEZI|nr:hypothetical protein BDY21DRAFT_197385 [Lineolata rhizophorae]
MHAPPYYVLSPAASAPCCDNDSPAACGTAGSLRRQGCGASWSAARPLAGCSSAEIASPPKNAGFPCAVRVPRQRVISLDIRISARPSATPYWPLSGKLVLSGHHSQLACYASISAPRPSDDSSVAHASLVAGVLQEPPRFTLPCPKPGFVLNCFSADSATSTRISSLIWWKI